MCICKLLPAVATALMPVEYSMFTNKKKKNKELKLWDDDGV